MTPSGHHYHPGVETSSHAAAAARLLLLRAHAAAPARASGRRRLRCARRPVDQPRRPTTAAPRLLLPHQQQPPAAAAPSRPLRPGRGMGGQAGAGSVGLLRSKLRTESTQRRRRSAGRVTAAASGPTAEHCCQPSRPSSTLDSLRCRLRWTTTNCSQRATRLYRTESS